MAAVWQHGPRSPEDLLALLAIADHANDDGVAYPGIARLAEKCRVTERTLRRTLRRLEDGGWLETTIGGGRSHTNLYRVIAKGDVDAPVSSGNPDVGDRNPDVGDTETLTPTSPEPSLEPSRKHGGRARASSPFPEGWTPDPDLVAWTKETCPLIDPRREWEQFRDHALANDRRQVDWRRAWMTGARRGQQFAESRRGKVSPKEQRDLDEGWR
jgi:DNA-binding HxlR family transcriptional regulator